MATSILETVVVKEICDANGLSEEHLVHAADRIDQLEMFHHNFPKMGGFAAFPNLRRLIVMVQRITAIEGLEFAPLLEEFWLVDCEITTIHGLNRNIYLRKLNLSGNKIAKIEHIDHLTMLESLWLNDNQITSLQGVQTLARLRELQLGGNRIEQLGHYLDSCVNLEILQLAGNRLSKFDDILHLASLPALTSLALSDPDFGDNPSSSLSNWRVYVVHNLRSLKLLDTQLVTAAHRAEADATYSNKCMFYNMHLKALKRQVHHILREAFEYQSNRAGQLNLSVHVLKRLFMDIQREIDEAKYYSSSELTTEQPDPVFLLQLNEKLTHTRAAVGEKLMEADSLEAAYTKLKAQLQLLHTQQIGQLMLELQTGGNVRLEEGTEKDVWVKSCSELVRSRFFANDVSAYGIGDIRVLRVTRIHNRLLRHRFDECVDRAVVADDGATEHLVKRSLEYLFFSHSQGVDQHMLSHVVMNGMDGIAAHNEPVLLANSVGLADLPRIAALREPKRSFKPSKLLIVKSFLTAPVQGKYDTPVTRSTYPCATAVFLPHNSDPRQRHWHVFDHSAMLPEYIVDYEYIPAIDETRFDGALAAAREVLDSFQIANLSPLMAKPVLEFIVKCSPLQTTDDSFTRVLNMPPVLQQRPKETALTDELILSTARTRTFATIKYLNLHNNNLRKIQNLGLLVNLKKLILSFNEIQKIEGLGELHQLKVLDLGFNLIKRIDGLQGLESLRCLYLNNNLVFRIEDVSTLKKYVAQLEDLSLRGNAVCEVKGYRAAVLRRLPELLFLDSKTINTSGERDAAQQQPSVVVAALVKANCKFYRDGPPLPEGASDEQLWPRVEELALDHGRLRKLHNVSRLVNLKRATFRDNELIRIDGLEACVRLESLNLEDNLIIKLQGIERLQHLTQLDLSYNKISHLDGVERLPRLKHLALDYNEVASLEPLHRCTNLAELYLANNRIGALKELSHLTPLPKLMILDVVNNPVCKDDELRLYCVYHLKSVKVLNGVGVEAPDIAAAKEQYFGRLSVEVLTAAIGHTNFDRVGGLTLTGFKLRDVSILRTMSFASLKELTLEQSGITDLTGIMNLPMLTIAKLNSNRIERYSQSDAPDAARLLNLEVLQLANNAIAEIRDLQLHRFPNLKVLFLYGNEITQVNSLEGVPDLRQLVLDRNKIRTIDPTSFKGVEHLRELRLDETGLRMIVGLLNLTMLQSLHLQGNRIQDLDQIERMAVFKDLQELFLAGNPVARKPLYRQFVLQNLPNVKTIDGKEVDQEERDRLQAMLDRAHAISQAEAAPPPPVVDALPAGLLIAGRGEIIKKPSLGMNVMTGLRVNSMKLHTPMLPELPAPAFPRKPSVLPLQRVASRKIVATATRKPGKPL